jgi:hypothetical protein
MFGRTLYYSTASRIAKSMPPRRRQAPTFGPHQAASATVRIYPPPSVAMLDIVDKRFDFVDIS